MAQYLNTLRQLTAVVLMIQFISESNSYTMTAMSRIGWAAGIIGMNTLCVSVDGPSHQFKFRPQHVHTAKEFLHISSTSSITETHSDFSSMFSTSSIVLSRNLPESTGASQRATGQTSALIPILKVRIYFMVHRK